MYNRNLNSAKTYIIKTFSYKNEITHGMRDHAKVNYKY